jgi:hypothetical protein
VKGRRLSKDRYRSGQVSDALGVDWPAPAQPSPPEAKSGSARPPGANGSASNALEKRLSEITQLDMDALRLAWADIYGRPPPKFMSRRLLELAAAYHAQAKVYGGLKPAIRRKLLQAASTPTGSSAAVLRRKARAALAPGSRLVREWRGRTHTVEVEEQGFLYAGRRYRSLSEIARAITGARWSGPRFFGL